MDTLDPNEEEQVIDRLVRNQIKIKELTEENDQLKSYFKTRPEIYQAGVTRKIGRFYLKITGQTRVNDALAKKVLSATVYNRLSKKVIDPTAAKKALTPEEYSAIINTYENRIEVGMND